MLLIYILKFQGGFDMQMKKYNVNMYVIYKYSIYYILHEVIETENVPTGKAGRHNKVMWQDDSERREGTGALEEYRAADWGLRLYSTVLSTGLIVFLNT